MTINLLKGQNSSLSKSESGLLGNQFAFYNNMASPCRSVEHTGDNRTGEGDGYGEALLIDLAMVPQDVQTITVTVTIEDYEDRRQSFGQAANAFIRIVHNETDKRVVQYDLTADDSTETAMVFGELYRHDGDWKFLAVGQGYGGGLAAMAVQHGLNAS